MLQVSNLSKAYGVRKLLDQVTFAVGLGERLGLVGRNGSGKSTLFKIILGQELADEGTITLPKSYRLGYLNQHIHFTQPSLLKECMQVLPEEQVYEHYRAEKILFGLGFEAKDMDRPPQEFSGGYQLRINLAKCLLQEPNLLLLDEPTNYLDIMSLRWMRKFLMQFPGEVVIITHDRDFMDSVCTHVMGIHRQKVLKVKGSTQKYYEQLKLQEEIYEKTRLNQEKKVKQMNEFVERFRAKASKATQAQSLLKKIEKIEVLEQLDADQIMGFQFHYAETPAKKLLTVENLSFGFTEPSLFEDLNFELKPQECVAVIGKNGKGKTTLLKVLAGDLTAKQGAVQYHPSANIGFYEQTNRKKLNSQNTIVQEIEQANVELATSQVRAICGAMMFSGDDALKKIKVLSGGEQARVLLGKVIAHKNNVLLLDEPTNHLDMESIEVLTHELSLFEGGCIVVTHDENILKNLAKKLIVFQNNGAFFFNGTYEEFLDKIGWEEEGSGSVKKSKSADKLDRHERAQMVLERSKLLKPLKKKQEALEKEIENYDKELEQLNSRVMQIFQQGAQENIQEVYRTIGQLQIKIEQAYKDLEIVINEIEKVPSF